MEQVDILRRAVELLEHLQAPYVVVGSIASIAYGESRFTQDIDIVAAFELAHVPDLLNAFPPPEYYLSEDAAREGILNRFQFNVIHPGSGHKIDFILPRDDAWARTQMSRRQATCTLRGRAAGPGADGPSEHRPGFALE
jgi:hypothetical protein